MSGRGSGGSRRVRTRFGAHGQPEGGTRGEGAGVRLGPGADRAERLRSQFGFAPAFRGLVSGLRSQGGRGVWIPLDSLVTNVSFQGVARDPGGFCCLRPASREDVRPLDRADAQTERQ